MDLTKIITIAVIVLIIGGALFYIIKQKRSGSKCIGCPYAQQCGDHNKSECEHCTPEDI